MDELITKRDAIEAVNDVLAEYIPTLRPWQSKITLACALKIKALPAVQTKRETTTLKIGRSRNSVTMWYECEKCGEPVDQEDAFCRRCGRGIIHE